MIKHNLFIPILLYSCFSCTPQQEQVEINQKPYFDLAQYFQKEAKELRDRNPEIQKKVSKNGQVEKKRMSIENWENEFGLFISSDINKSDWLNSYTIDSTALKISYQRKDPKLRTANIIIHQYKDGTIKQIHIVNTDKNWLYRSTEELDYFPDSLYRIYKQQSIRIIGENQYTIEGIFNR